jgi:hypothetical protein
LLNTIITTKSPFLNLSNPLFYTIIRSTVYDQFNAGTTPAEVQKSITRTKRVGYQGVILGHTREIESEEDLKTADETCSGTPSDICVSKWLDLNLSTLSLLGKGDYINVKVTGAGPAMTNAFATHSPLSEQMLSALDTIIVQARKKGVVVWMDAEQQAFQPAIDDLVIDLMRKYNSPTQLVGGGEPLVWNTIQAYLKSSRANLERHVRLSREEGWSLGIKLVRGAYIGTEERELLWSTKQQTDENYDSIIDDILRGNVKGMARSEGQVVPKIWLFAAGHNTASVEKAMKTIKALNSRGIGMGSGRGCPQTGFAQLQGMADELGCSLLCQREEMVQESTQTHEESHGLLPTSAEKPRTNTFSKPLPNNETPHPTEREGSIMIPKILKCLAWGDVTDCTHFLMRRTVENGSAAERIREGREEMKRELWRRVRLRLRLGLGLGLRDSN